MPTSRRPRRGSLQFWPRKRASKVLPSINWRPILAKEQGLLGFIAYKVGMSSVLVKDATEKVTTSKKTIVLPATILEIPNMKILSARFYKNNLPLKDVIVSSDKELKRKLKITKQTKKLEENIPENYDDIRVVAYSTPSSTSIKKTPDVIELAVQSDNKLDYIKSLLGKEITLENLSHQGLLDVRGLTKGKGVQGPVKRFGVKLRFHKSEKGVRKVGSIGPWHPARVTFRTPMAGQLGFFTRIIYNLVVLDSGKISEKDINPKQGFKNYGKVKTSYIILKGSVQGPVKRQILITPSFRPSKLQSKRKYQFIEVLR